MWADMAPWHNRQGLWLDKRARGENTVKIYRQQAKNWRNSGLSARQKAQLLTRIRHSRPIDPV
jgi:hypothetical protein